MPKIQYSRRAEQELADILAYTKQRWGDAQAGTYFQELADTFNLLARYKEMGRSLSATRPTWRRFEQASHVLLYQSIPDGIRIQRIIHKRRLVQPHLQ
ncbi:MAG TPA: type II toxin-antitoxin system RelE/ParE family toxin [Acidobacteriaceae bacterium]|nr:type II toxin-antitoxin system RelE/ParE family toxin [Acidobacteriaceae bacterium]